MIISYSIERVTAENYPLFDDMIHWRETGAERVAVDRPVDEEVRKELCDPNLYVYAVRVEGRYVGWISILYLPKVGKWHGHGHLYVDELWVAPLFRGRGLAKALMQKADELLPTTGAAGIRLYVNVNNPSAQKLYEACGYRMDGQAYFMEK